MERAHGRDGNQWNQCPHPWIPLAVIGPASLAVVGCAGGSAFDPIERPQEKA